VEVGRSPVRIPIPQIPRQINKTNLPKQLATPSYSDARCSRDFNNDEVETVASRVVIHLKVDFRVATRVEVVAEIEAAEVVVEAARGTIENIGK